MLRLLGCGLLVACVGSLGCGDGTGSSGTGGTIYEPGPICTPFCAKVVGECEAFTFNEAECQQGCEGNLAEERAKSEACGEAAEAVFQCVSALDCDGVFDWRNREPLDDYPCRDEVAMVDEACAEN